MPDKVETFGEVPLFSYVLASADLRYIEVNERAIYLRKDANFRWVVRGEIAGCGPDCFADLSQILLEYATSCEGCKDQRVVDESVAHFGKRLGRILATRISQGLATSPGLEQLSAAFECVLRSMNAPFTVEHTDTFFHYILAYCPLRAAAKSTGFSREVAAAHKSFVALCESILRALAPGWALQKPSKEDNDIPLLKVEIVKS